jgi:hypothetical protein
MWAKAGKTRRNAYSVPTSVRLRPEIDCKIQNLREDFPGLTQSKIINDLLDQALQLIYDNDEGRGVSRRGARRGTDETLPGLRQVL